jgi:hypothetical protein
MFTSISSLDSVVQCLLPVFAQPSFQTHIEVLIGWVMCLSKRTEYGVSQAIQADTPVSRQQRHPFDRFYNFFSRSAWMVRDLAHQVAVAVVVQLNPRGLLYFVSLLCHTSDLARCETVLCLRAYKSEAPRQRQGLINTSVTFMVGLFVPRFPVL